MPKLTLVGQLAEELKCDFEENTADPRIKTNDKKETSVSGLYVVGDISQAKHNATIASAYGVIAGISAHQALIYDQLESVELDAAYAFSH